MESLHMAQRDSGNAIDVARVLIDRPTQTGAIIKSAGGTSALPVDILTSSKCLLKYSDPETLPTQLGGEQSFNPQEYVEFHEDLNDKISQCTESLEGILSAAHSLSRVPRTIRHCSQVIQEHKATIALLNSNQKTIIRQHNQSRQKLSNEETITPIYKSHSFASSHPRQIGTSGSSDCIVSTPGDVRQSSYPVPAPRQYLPDSALGVNQTDSWPISNQTDSVLTPNMSAPLREHLTVEPLPVCRPNLLDNTLQLNLTDTTLLESNLTDKCSRPTEVEHSRVHTESEPVPVPRPNLADLLLEHSETGKTLSYLQTRTRGTDIYSTLIDSLNTLTLLTSDVTQLKTLAGERLTKLYGYEKIWFFIEDITKKLSRLKKAHETINKYRTSSSNLRAARHQRKNFSKTAPAIRRLLKQCTELLADVLAGLARAEVEIPWLEQLSTKLKTELDFISSLFAKTEDLVSRTYNCYIKIDEAYDWALDAMKQLSQHSMDNYMTHDALELLANGLKSFMNQKTFIDDVVFDEISKEARFLSNRKLSDQCKVAKRRCSDTRHLLKTRCAMVAKKQQLLTSTGCFAAPSESDIQTSEVCSQEWRLRCSQSAPATPALTLRFNNNNDLNRRSQSLEDDIATELLEHIQNASLTSDIDVIVSPLVEVIAVETEDLDSSSPASVDVDIAEFPVGCESPKLPYAVSIANSTPASATDSTSSTISNCDQEVDDNERPEASDVTESAGENASLVSSDVIVEEFSPDISNRCHTVYRGDKFLEHNEVIIPLEEDVHFNNNHLEIQSPTMESGHIIYAPPGKPLPAKRLTLSQCNTVCSSTQSSMESDVFDSPIVSPLDHIPRATFDNIVDNNSSTENLSHTNTLVAPSSSGLSTHCKLSPVHSVKQKQKAMQKRKSFHGFSAIAMPILNFAKHWKNTDAENSKRLSLPDHDIIDEEIAVGLVDSLEPSIADQVTQLSEIECSLKEKDTSKLLKIKRMDKSMSLITGSSDSLPSLPEDDVMDCNSLPRSKHRHSAKIWSPIPVNSHLMSRRVLPSHRSASMADLRLTESEIKSRVTLAHIMDELVQTERDYVVALGLVVDSYIPELNREDVPQTLRGKRAVIFGNIEKIYEFHNRYFLEDITKCENEPFKIGQCFLKHSSEFLMYALYNKNKPKSDSLMLEYGAAFFREQQSVMGDKMDLSSYLLKPVQRMGKYALILKQVLKECSESVPEYQDLASAEEMIRFCLQHGNDLLAMDSLEDCDVNLQEQGTLLLQEEFTVWKNKKKMIRHLFLFEHLLVLSKARRINGGGDQYIYKSSLKTADVGLTENVGSSGVKFEIWFRKRTGESWTFQAPNSQIKNCWVNVIEKLLWTQALKNRESRLSELTTMGVGHKPSLDLKKSADNINDRFIPSVNKSSLTCNRHSVGCLEMRDNVDPMKKRPYSVISLSASSSSASSAGSTGPGTSRRSLPWLDLKSAVIGKGMDSFRGLRLRKMYKSDPKIHRCDSGISSSSDIAPTIGYHVPPKILSNVNRERAGSETEV